MKSRTGLALFCLSVALGVSLGAEGQIPGHITQLLPADSLGLVRLRGVPGSVARLRKSAVGRVYLEREVQEAIAPLLGKARVEWDKVAAAIKLDLKDILDAVSGPVTLAVPRMRLLPGKPEPQPDLLLLVQLSKGREAWDLLVQSLTTFLKNAHPGFMTSEEVIEGVATVVFPLGETELLLATVAGHAVVNSNRAAMTEFLAFQNKADRHTLADTAMTMAFGKYLGAQPDLVAMLNVELTLTPQAEKRTEKQNRDLRYLGLDKVKGIGFSSTFTEEEVEDTLYLYSPEGMGGIFRMVRSEPLELDAFRLVPQGAVALALARVDPLQMWSEFLSLLQENEPGKALDVAERLPMLEQKLGFRFEDELLPSLGQEMALYLTQPHGALIPDVVLVVPLADAAAFDRCLGQVRAALGPKWRFRQLDHEGRKLHYNSRKKLCPCFAVTEDAVIFSLFMPSLKRALHSREEKKSLADLPQAVDELRLFGKGKSLLLRANTRRLFDVAYTTLYPFARTTPEEELPVNWHALPRAGVLSRHMQATRYALSFPPDGLLLEGASPFGGALPIALTIVAATAENEKKAAAAAGKAAQEGGRGEEEAVVEPEEEVF